MLVWTIVVILAILTILAKKPELLKKAKKNHQVPTDTEEKTKFDPKILIITIGIVVFNLISWAMIPWWWDIITDNGWVFVIFNLGFWTVLFLKTIKVKGVDGKETEKNHSTASWLATTLTVMILLGIFTTIKSKGWSWPSWGNIKESGKRDVQRLSASGLTNVPGKTYMFGPEHVPAEVALKIIGSCESLGHPNGIPVHYEKDGKTLLKNKEGAPARGKYQMIPAHWEEAKKLTPSLNLDIEKDYDAYALHLYNTTGTQHWQFIDPRGRGGPLCWGPTLISLAGRDNITLPMVLAVVTAPIGDWSRKIDNPHMNGAFTDWSKPDNCEIMPDGNINGVLPCNKSEFKYPLKFFQFRSTGKEPLEIKVIVRR